MQVINTTLVKNISFCSIISYVLQNISNTDYKMTPPYPKLSCCAWSILLSDRTSTFLISKYRFKHFPISVSDYCVYFTSNLYVYVILGHFAWLTKSISTYCFSPCKLSINVMRIPFYCNILIVNVSNVYQFRHVWNSAI